MGRSKLVPPPRNVSAADNLSSSVYSPGRNMSAWQLLPPAKWISANLLRLSAAISSRVMATALPQAAASPSVEPDSSKQQISMNVTICSRKAAEELLRTDTLSRTAVISFCDPPSVGKPAPVPPLDYAGKAARVFTVVVHDLDLTALPDVGLDYDTYMPEADALAAFICQARADGLDILCQCEYGQSRSTACAAAILEYFNGTGISVFADYRYYPNQVVYHKIMDALTRYGPETQSST